MTDISKKLQTLNSAFGPSGDEAGIASVIKELAAPFVDEIWSDVMGNVICHKKGNGPKVMFAAHMDSLGFVVTYIEKEGFLRVGKLGGVRPQNVIYTPVRFKNGTLGAVASDEGVSESKLQMDDLYLDIGADSEQKARELVKVGDAAIYNTPVMEAGDCVISPYLDNRICCVALLMAMEQVKESENDLYFVFTTQEELGMRGAKTAAYAIDPDYGICIDVTRTSDIPESSHGCSSVCGGGAAIKVMDSSVICHPKVVEKLRNLAEDRKINYQMDILQAGGTDTSVMQQTRAGVLTGGISVPCRYLHTPTETARLGDVEACIALIQAFAESKLEKV